MKAHHRYWAGILTAAIMALTPLLFAGCGGNQSGGQQAAPKQVTIEYWHINSESFGLPAVREIIRRFEQQNPDIKVTEKFFNGYMPLMQGVQAAIASGNPPAVAQIGYNYLSYATENIPHITIDEIIAMHPEDKDFLTANYLSNILELGRANGKLQGMPYSISNPILYYNPELFQKAGLDPAKGPATWEEVEAFAKQIKEKTGAYGLYVQEPADSWAQQAMMMSNGARILINTNGKFSTGIGSPEAIEAMERYARMALQDKTALHTGHEEGYQAFVSGKVAMLVTTIARRSAIEKNAPFKSQAVPFPTYGGKPRQIVAGGNNLFVFAKDQAQQKAAWKFIKFLENPESLTEWTKGTGYLPPRKGVADDPNGLGPMLKENVMMRAAVSQLPEVKPWISFPGQNGLQIEQVLLDARESLLSGKKTAKDSLTESAQKIDDLLK